ncbi:hypothetical protein CGH87_16095 [Vibrio parahaemolyticus]|nr:hypothetical protein [Vibrio parahaemolyticus]ETZ09185.1 hypothetical protein AJ90_07565 [Vibrio parahaemolyticus M0605]RFD60383.1 hypothetical protein H322_022005 [Vibrio parahaemolyticus VP551]EGR1189243.1 hypothetical protein [Vibrio parahaemolyticus]EGR1192807.1 hypothetical protein [Vibrio parahaemolyticus]
MIVVLFGFVIFSVGHALFMISVLSFYDSMNRKLTSKTSTIIFLIGTLLMTSGFLLSPLWLIQQIGMNK